jgi:hypothetical protein
MMTLARAVLLGLGPVAATPAARNSSCHGCTSRPGVTAGRGHLQHSVGVPSANHCCLACAQLRACILWEYAEAERACWLKDNIGPITPRADREIGSCAASPLPPPGPAPPSPPPPPAPPPTNLSITVTLAPGSSHAQPRVALPEFVSFCLDWWHPQEGCSPEGWGPNATVLEIDLSSPRLLAVATAMAPAFLRIGGSLDKKVHYAVPGGDTFNASGCPADLCLTGERWSELVGFCQKTGLRLVFGLSYPTIAADGQHAQHAQHDDASDSGRWNSSQARALFEFAAGQGHGRDAGLCRLRVTVLTLRTPGLTENRRFRCVLCVCRDAAT